MKFLLIFFYNLLILSLLIACNQAKDPHHVKAFNYNQVGTVASLDPIMANDQAKSRLVGQIFNTLFELDSTGQLQPALIDSFTQSPDGKIYTYFLRKDVYFHKNTCFGGNQTRLLTANDVKYSFERLLSPNSRGAWIFSGKINTNLNPQGHIDAFEVIDSFTCRIHLLEPFATFNNLLSMPFTGIVPKEAVDFFGKDFAKNPVGSGPFVFDQWVQSERIILKKNTQYWKKDIFGKKLPYLDLIHVKFIDDKNAEFLALKMGDIHFASGLDADAKAQIFEPNGQISPAIAQNFTVQKVPYLSTEYIGFQLDPQAYADGKHPFLDPKVRQALSLCIDKKLIINFLRDGQGHQGDGGFSPKALATYELVRQSQPENAVLQAQKLLAQAGYANGKNFPPITLYTTPSENHPRIAQYLTKQWQALLGIKIQIEVNPFPVHKEKVRKGEAFLFRGSWLDDYPEEENFLSLFYGANKVPAGPNDTRFVDKAYDSLYNQAKRTENQEERRLIYAQMERIIIEKAPVIVLFYDDVLRICSKKVIGLAPDHMNSLKLETVDLLE